MSPGYVRRDRPDPDLPTGHGSAGRAPRRAGVEVVGPEAGVGVDDVHRRLLGRRRAAVDADVLPLDRVGPLHHAELLRVGQPARAVERPPAPPRAPPGPAARRVTPRRLAGDGDLVVVERVGPVGGE